MDESKTCSLKETLVNIDLHQIAESDPTDANAQWLRWILSRLI